MVRPLEMLVDMGEMFRGGGGDVDRGSPVILGGRGVDRKKGLGEEFVSQLRKIRGGMEVEIEGSEVGRLKTVGVAVRVYKG